MNQSDVVKTILAPVITAVLVSVPNVSVMQSEMDTVKQSIKKLDIKVEKFDERVRKVEIELARVTAGLDNQYQANE